MKTLDKDIGWLFTPQMMLCVCEHRMRSHRPISLRCILCDCQKFTEQDPHLRKERRHLHERRRT